MKTLQCFIGLFIFSMVLETAQGSLDQYLPTFMWEPENPFFQCSDRLIKIRKEDHLPVFCGTKIRHNYLSDNFNAKDKPTEIVAVDTEEEYNSCDITKGSRPVLKCDFESQKLKQTCKSGLECTIYNTLKYYHIGPEPTTMRAGKIYRFVGVKQGGTDTSPCQGNSTDFPMSMKFKVYICTEKDKLEGLCEPCNTEGCYYKGCKVDCGAWTNNSTNIFQDASGNCYQQQNQICMDKLLSTSTQKTREHPIPCPKSVCERWRESDSILYKDGACSKQKDRECRDFRGKITVEREAFAIDCPPKTCTEWGLLETIKRQKGGAGGTTSECFIKQRKFCTFQPADGDTTGNKQVVSETQEISTECPKPETTPAPVITTTTLNPTPDKKPQPTTTEPKEPSVAAATNGNNDNETDKVTYIYIIIGASLASMVFGIILGYCLTRCCQGTSTSGSLDLNSDKMVPIEAGVGPIIAYENKNFTLDPVMEDGQLADVEFIPATATIGKTKRQVMVARSISFYNAENNPHRASSLKQKQPLGRSRSNDGSHISDRHSDHVTMGYRPPSTINESSRNVMRHPSATSKTVLIRHSSDVTERNRSDSDTSVFNLKQPNDCVSEEV